MAPALVPENLRDAISPRALKSINSRSESTVARSNKPNSRLNDWKLRLRSRPSEPAKDSAKVTTIETSSSPAKKRKVLYNTCPQVKKRPKAGPKTRQNSERPERRSATGKHLSTKRFEQVNLDSGGHSPDHIAYTAHQNSTCGSEQLTKRKRSASLIEGSPDTGESVAKRRKLTKSNLKLLEKDISSKDAKNVRKNMTSSIPTNDHSIISAKRSCPSLLSDLNSTFFSLLDHMLQPTFILKMN